MQFEPSPLPRYSWGILSLKPGGSQMGKPPKKIDGKRMLLIVVFGIIVLAVLLRRFSQLLH